MPSRNRRGGCTGGRRRCREEATEGGCDARGVAPLPETQMDNRIGTLEDRLETRISLLESKVDGVAKHSPS